jgi:hypothetical protein
MRKTGADRDRPANGTGTGDAAGATAPPAALPDERAAGAAGPAGLPGRQIPAPGPAADVST